MPTKEEILAEARAAGIDLDLLDANLAMSVKERWEQHQAALELAEKLRSENKLTEKDMECLSYSKIWAIAGIPRAKGPASS